MAEDVADKIVERLKAEGQLTRNTGTNSIKSVRTDLYKFELIFESINTTLIEQTQILQETLELQLLESGRAERARQLAEADRTRPPPTPPAPPPSPPGAPQPGPNGGLGGLLSLFSVGGIGGGVGAAAAGVLAALRTPLKTALFAVIAPSIGKLVGGFTEAALLELGVDASAATMFGEAAGMAGLFGFIGAAFGRRMGLISAGFGAGASFADDVLDALGMDKDRMITILGQEMQLETAVQGIMGALGASLSIAITSPTFRASINSFFRDAVGADGEVISRLTRRRAAIGSAIGLGVLTAYMMHGDEVSQWLQNQGMPAGFADTTVDVAGLTATGASLGMMFGAQGAVVGAALGFAIGLGKNIVDWLIAARDNASAAFREESQEVSDIIARANSGESITEEERRRLAEHLAEATRRMQLVIPPGETTFAEKQITAARSALSTLPLSAQEGVTPEQLGQRVMGALGGDAGSMQELLDFAIGRESETANSLFRFSSKEKFIRRLLEGLASEIDMDYLMQNPQAYNEWRRMVSEILEREGFRTGTKGFQDFGSGSFAILHGREAVVPETTPAGQFLKTFFDENWRPIIGMIGEASNAALNQTRGNVTYAPITMSPVNSTNVAGGSSSTIINSFARDRMDLDMMSRPGGVQ